MMTKTVEALVVVLNAHTELSKWAVREGIVGWSVGAGYSVPDMEAPEAPEAPASPDLRTETLGRIVAVFEAFESRKDQALNARLTELGEYLTDCGWIDITKDGGYVAPSINIPVIPLDAIELIVYVLNAWDNHAFLTLHDGLARLAGYLTDAGLIAYPMRAGYTVPDMEAPEPRIIPFVPKD